MAHLFSHKEAAKSAVAVKIRRAMIMSKTGINKEFKIQHPDWVRDAAKNNYVELKAQVKEQVERVQALAITRRMKTVAK